MLCTTTVTPEKNMYHKHRQSKVQAIIHLLNVLFLVARTYRKQPVSQFTESCNYKPLLAKDCPNLIKAQEGTDPSSALLLSFFLHVGQPLVSQSTNE